MYIFLYEINVVIKVSYFYSTLYLKVTQFRGSHFFSSAVEDEFDGVGRVMSQFNEVRIGNDCSKVLRMEKNSGYVNVTAYISHNEACDKKSTVKSAASSKKKELIEIDLSFDNFFSETSTIRLLNMFDKIPTTTLVMRNNSEHLFHPIVFVHFVSYWDRCNFFLVLHALQRYFSETIARRELFVNLFTFPRVCQIQSVTKINESTNIVRFNDNTFLVYDNCFKFFNVTLFTLIRHLDLSSFDSVLSTLTLPEQEEDCEPGIFVCSKFTLLSMKSSSDTFVRGVYYHPALFLLIAGMSDVSYYVKSFHVTVLLFFVDSWNSLEESAKGNTISEIRDCKTQSDLLRLPRLNNTASSSDEGAILSDHASAKEDDSSSGNTVVNIESDGSVDREIAQNNENYYIEFEGEKRQLMENNLRSKNTENSLGHNSRRTSLDDQIRCSMSSVDSITSDRRRSEATIQLEVLRKLHEQTVSNLIFFFIFNRYSDFTDVHSYFDVSAFPFAANKFLSNL